jgi:hypothetical protein
MISHERIEGEMVRSHAMVIIQYEPRKVFLRGFNVDDELANEVLYIENTNDNNALISPNGFPYFNLNLDPLGSLMRKNRHLTILEAGGRYLVDMLKMGMVQYKKRGNFDERFQIELLSDGTTKLIVNNEDYAFEEYTVLKGETVRDICNKKGLPEYKIVELNEDLEDFNDCKEGQVITIPNLYAKRFELEIRNNDFVPVHVKIFDDKGLFAEYEYIYFNSVPNINANTFNKENPAYTF